MTRKHKLSKHGTLAEADVTGAMPIRVSQVVLNCDDPNFKEYFGGAGELPPEDAVESEAKWAVFYQVKDPKTGQDWIGMNKLTNSDKGEYTLDLSEGEYKVEFQLPKALNANLAVDAMGPIIGGLASLGAQDTKKAEEKYKRGIPQQYLDVRIRATGKKYGIIDERGIMDLGVHRSFVRTFKLTKREAPAKLSLTLYSHSILKRLKVIIKIFRRDIVRRIESDLQRQIWLEKRGKQLLRKALDETETPKANGTPSKRLLPEVDVHEMIEDFYRAYAPDKVARAAAVVEHFEGRVDDMIKSIELKYNVVFDQHGRASTKTQV